MTFFVISVLTLNIILWIVLLVRFKRLFSTEKIIEKTEQQIKKQGLAQEKLNVITQDYRSKYGQNFPAYLDEESLENYTIAYLHAYDARRSDVEKMYDDALNNEYADKIEPSEMEPSSKTMGYAKAWLLTIIMLVTSIIVFIFCIMISK